MLAILFNTPDNAHQKARAVLRKPAGKVLSFPIKERHEDYPRNCRVEQAINHPIQGNSVLQAAMISRWPLGPVRAIKPVLTHCG